MSRIFLIGDLHFGDDNIIHLENRPFHNNKQQTDELVELWNSVVRDDDVVYVFGDFVKIGCSDYHYQKIQELKGIRYLIKGNHDTESDKFYIDKCGFEKVYDVPIIIDDFWIFSHFPMYVNRNSPYANVFAHVHNNPIYTTHSCRSYCVSAERTGFIPILFDEVKNVILQDCDK